MPEIHTAKTLDGVHIASDPNAYSEIASAPDPEVGERKPKPRPAGSGRSRVVRYHGRVIPTLVLAGLVLGRWWRVVIPLGIIAWIGLLIATHVGSGVGFAISAGGVALVNLAVGVIVFQSIWLVSKETVHKRGTAGSSQ
jgi:hypothetical protein